MIQVLHVALAAFFWVIAASTEAACIADLPEPVTNNAVAQANVNGTNYLLSFMGLSPTASAMAINHTNIHRRAWMLQEGASTWQALPDVPVEAGRLAATATGIGDTVYLFGGYTVAADGSEYSTPDNFAFHVPSTSYRRLAPTPIPVDDTVSLVYQNRYIYLVSGWHDIQNVSAVQIYDTRHDIWLTGDTYPGTPVFGHAGGIVGNTFVIADGVAISEAGESRQFDTINEGWLGHISSDDPTRISYQRLPQLPGRGHYRMAATGDPANRRILFAGGTATAYNYTGIGYDGTPAKPSAHVFAWLLDEQIWRAYPDKPTASMDHRRLLPWGGNWLTVGGMIANQKIIAEAHSLINTHNCKR